VWSLDLRTGETTWSVMLPALVAEFTCLPGSNVVAVTENAPRDEPFAITLLDGATGATLDLLRSTETVQVIPLGKNMGLVGPDNVLTMVTRQNINSSRWTRTLTGLEAESDSIYAHPLSDDTVQLF